MAPAATPGTRHGSFPDLLTPPEVCAHLRISRSTFYRLASAGRIETVRLGGPVSSIRVTGESLDRFLHGESPTGRGDEGGSGRAMASVPGPPAENDEAPS